MKYLEGVHVRAPGHIQPLDSRALTPGDALKILAALREVLGVSMGSEPWEKDGGEGGSTDDSHR